MSERKLKFILPIAILVVGLVGTVVMIKSRAPVPTRAPRDYAPLVRVVPARPATVRLTVTTHGTVKPRTESALVSEVSGRVIGVAPSFAAGGFFEESEVLVTVDPRDYELAVVSARGQVAQARVRLETEQAQAEVAREEWQALGGGKESPLATRELQLQEAQAALAAAEAALEQAKRNLARTRIRAPFAGRIRDKRVDVGQFVTPGVPVALIFAVDYVEVELPIPDVDLAYLDLPVDYRGVKASDEGPEVFFHADFAGRRHAWHGRIVRVGGEIDPVTRMVHAVAQVHDPYGEGRSHDGLPLAVGLFVEAEIAGIEVENAIELPRAAVRQSDVVLVVDDEDRLRFRTVEVFRTDRDSAIITGGLAAGDRVCISPLETVTDGTKVRVADSEKNSPSNEVTSAEDNS